MKTLLKIAIITVLLMNAYCLLGQAAVGISASLDNKLTFFEDDYGNSPFTLDLTTKLSLQGYQKELGYLQVDAKYEFADLSSGELHRYGASLGYVFTFFDSNTLGLMPFAGYGILKRQYAYSISSWEFGGTLSIKIVPCLKVISSIVWTERGFGYRMNMNTGLQFDINTNYLNL